MSVPLLALLALAATPSVDDAPRNGVSLEIPGLFWNGVELVGERQLHPRISVLLALGGRVAGEADYSTFTLGAGAGVRFWLNRFQLLSDLGGPLLGRLDGAWTRITDRQRGTRLETTTGAVSLRLGYRFVIVRRIEVTPEAGLAVSLGVDNLPRLATTPRPSLLLGLTVGYLF